MQGVQTGSHGLSAVFCSQAEDEPPVYVRAVQAHADGGPRAVPPPGVLRGVSLHEDPAAPLHK